MIHKNLFVIAGCSTPRIFNEPETNAPLPEDHLEAENKENEPMENNNDPQEDVPARKKRRTNMQKQQKKLRDHGNEARNRAGKIIPRVEFRPLEICCRKKCFEKINESQQRDYHKKFFECSKTEQNQILAGGIIVSKKKN